MNCPFPAGAGREQILGALHDRLVPAARAFKPDLVLISAGFDSRRGDPLGRFELDDGDFIGACSPVKYPATAVETTTNAMSDVAFDCLPVVMAKPF